MVNDIRAVMFLVIFHFFSFISVSHSFPLFEAKCTVTHVDISEVLSLSWPVR